MKRERRIKVITGGIGSGKSFVCNLLKERGIKVYDCDSNAKRLMVESEEIRQRLTALIGGDAYVDGRLNKAAIAAFLLKSEENNKAINDAVHPVVISDFIASDCDWMESAIYFEAGINRRLSRKPYVVCVSAPLEVRTQRVMSRDHISRAKAEEWIQCQMAQEEKESGSDFTIVNDGCRDLEEQISCLLSDIQLRG